MELQGASQVAVVGPDNKIHIQAVQAGQQVGNQWIIDSGLNPNDRVVVEGTLMAKEGTVVDPQPYYNQDTASGNAQTNVTARRIVEASQ